MKSNQKQMEKDDRYKDCHWSKARICGVSITIVFSDIQKSEQLPPSLKGNEAHSGSEMMNLWLPQTPQV